MGASNIGRVKFSVRSGAMDGAHLSFRLARSARILEGILPFASRYTRVEVRDLFRGNFELRVSGTVDSQELAAFLSRERGLFIRYVEYVLLSEAVPLLGGMEFLDTASL